MVAIISSVFVPVLAIILTILNKYIKYKDCDSEVYLNNLKKNKILRFNKLCENLESEIDWWFFYDKCKCYILKREIKNELMLNARDLNVKESDLELFDNGDNFRLGKYIVSYHYINYRSWLKIVKN